MRTRKPLASTFAILLLLGSLSAFSVQEERFIEISTDIDVIHYSSRTNGSERRRSYPATCVIGKNRWSIDIKFMLNAMERYYFDGTNVQRWAQITEKAPTRPRQPGQPILGNPGPEDGIWVKIMPGGHPLGHLGVNVVWMTFCSADYLKSPGRVIPIPGAEIKSRVDAFTYLDKTKTFDDGLGLPETIQLFSSRDAFNLSQTKNPIARTRQANSFRPTSNLNLPDGLLALDYSVLSSINVSGWTIPTKFTMTEYGKSRAGDWTKTVVLAGTVISLRPVAAVRDEPFKGETYHVTDYRLPKQQPPDR